MGSTKVSVPSFSAILRATPVDPNPNPGLGYYVGSGVANQLLSMSQSSVNNAQQKQAILGFADAMEGTDPATASMYRSMADAIPSFDVTALNNTGSGGGGSIHGSSSRSPGVSMGGATGAVMGNMLDTMKMMTAQRNALALDNARTRNDMLMENLRNRNQIDQITAGQNARIAAIKEKERADKETETLKAALKMTQDPIKQRQLQQKITASENNVKVAETNLRAAEISSQNNKDAVIEQSRAKSYEADKKLEAARVRGNAKSGTMTKDDYNYARSKNPSWDKRWQDSQKKIKSTNRDEAVAGESEMAKLKAEIRDTLGNMPDPITGIQTPPANGTSSPAPSSVGSYISSFKSGN